MKFYAKPRRRPTIIIVTMIDIFCVLLIFFIVATTFRKTLPAIHISIPESKGGAPMSQDGPLVLSITPDEKIFLNTREVSLAQLSEALEELGKQEPRPKIAMRADKKAPFGLVVKVMDVAKAAGFTQLPAFVEQETENKP